MLCDSNMYLPIIEQAQNNVPWVLEPEQSLQNHFDHFFHESLRVKLFDSVRRESWR